MVVVQSHFIVKPNLVLRLGWGFDKNSNDIISPKNDWSFCDDISQLRNIVMIKKKRSKEKLKDIQAEKTLDRLSVYTFNLSKVSKL